MPQAPVSDEIAAALGRFFFAGEGPSHSATGNAVDGAGYHDDDPYDPKTREPNKEIRVRTVVKAAKRRPARARELVNALLVQLRVHGCFNHDSSKYDREKVLTAQRAFPEPDGRSPTTAYSLPPAPST